MGSRGVRRGPALRASIPDKNPDDLGVLRTRSSSSPTPSWLSTMSHHFLHSVMSNFIRARTGDNLDLLYDQAAGVVRQVCFEDLQASPSGIGAGWRGSDDRQGDHVDLRPPRLRVGGEEAQGAHPERGHHGVLSQRLETSFTGGRLQRLPRAAHGQPVAVHVLPVGDSRRGASPEMHVRVEDGASRPGPSPARGRAADGRGGRRARGGAPRRPEGDAPSTSCWSTSAATTSAACAIRARCRSPELMTVERYSHVMHIWSPS